MRIERERSACVLDDNQVDFRKFLQDTLIEGGFEPAQELAATRPAQDNVGDSVFASEGDQGYCTFSCLREMTRPPIFWAVSRVSATCRWAVASMRTADSFGVRT